MKEILRKLSSRPPAPVEARYDEALQRVKAVIVDLKNDESEETLEEVLERLDDDETVIAPSPIPKELR